MNYLLSSEKLFSLTVYCTPYHRVEAVVFLLDLARGLGVAKPAGVQAKLVWNLCWETHPFPLNPRAVGPPHRTVSASFSDSSLAAGEGG